jgi:hypothetical protein
MQSICDLLNVKEVILSMAVSASAFVNIFCQLMHVANRPIESSVYSNIVKEVQQKLQTLRDCGTIDQNFLNLPVQYSASLIKAMHIEEKMSTSYLEAANFKVELYHQNRFVTSVVSSEFLQIFTQPSNNEFMVAGVNIMEATCETSRLQLPDVHLAMKDNDHIIPILDDDDIIDVDIRSICKDYAGNYDLHKYTIDLINLMSRCILDYLMKTDDDFLTDGKVRLKYCLKANRDCERDLSYIQTLLKRNVHYGALYMGCILMIRSFPPELYVTIDTFTSSGINIRAEANILCKTTKTRLDRAVSRTKLSLKKQSERMQQIKKQTESNILLQFCSRYTPKFYARNVRQKFRVYKADLIAVLDNLKHLNNQAFNDNKIQYSTSTNIDMLTELVKKVAKDILHLTWRVGLPLTQDGYTVEEPQTQSIEFQSSLQPQHISQPSDDTQPTVMEYNPAEWNTIQLNGLISFPKLLIRCQTIQKLTINLIIEFYVLICGCSQSTTVYYWTILFDIIDGNIYLTCY